MLTTCLPNGSDGGAIDSTSATGPFTWTSTSPVSSRSSRRSACSIVSPGSTPPPGISQ
jgi:hypothetical protein